jgi:hypothetical protein
MTNDSVLMAKIQGFKFKDVEKKTKIKIVFFCKRLPKKKSPIIQLMNSLLSYFNRRQKIHFKNIKTKNNNYSYYK